MWELFLKCCIDRDVSTVQVRTGVIYCNLIKIDPMLWLEIAESMPGNIRFEFYNWLLMLYELF